MSRQNSDEPSTAGIGGSTPRSGDAGRVIDEYRYLLEDVPPIGDVPAEPDGTVLALLALATKAHMLALVGLFYVEERPLRFGQLRTGLDISAKVLSRRLGELTEAGLVTRCWYDESPPRVEYELTKKADELCPAFQFLYAWAARHDLEPDR